MPRTLGSAAAGGGGERGAPLVPRRRMRGRSSQRIGCRSRTIASRSSSKSAALPRTAAIVLCVATWHRSLSVARRSLRRTPTPFADDPVPVAPPVDEPYANRWRRRFELPDEDRSGYLFFKHLRKAGGSSLRYGLYRALEVHGHATAEQFLEREGRNRTEVERHYPFLEEGTKRRMERYYENGEVEGGSDAAARNDGDRTRRARGAVYYIEQEFSSMDWNCRYADAARWNASLSVIALRHPVERHLSELLYSGMETEYFGVDRARLATDGGYRNATRDALEAGLRSWAVPRATWDDFEWFLSNDYIDNFQLRALAGCSSGECLKNKTINQLQLNKIESSRPKQNAHNNATMTSPVDVPAEPLHIDSVCTMHPMYGWGKHGHCRKYRHVCPSLCDGPCQYPSVAWGNATRDDLRRAVAALKGFDVVLLTETLDRDDQRALLDDVLGVPRGALREATRGRRINVNAAKEGERDATHYYRDLFGSLEVEPGLLERLAEENSLEVELYEAATRMNWRMTEAWKREVGWGVVDQDDNASDGG